MSIDDVENDLYLVGIYEDDEERIMVYYQGDKCFINHFFSNGYGEMPQVELKDADDDGEDDLQSRLKEELDEVQQEFDNKDWTCPYEGWNEDE